MKVEWKKSEKSLYLPGARPELLTVPTMNFFTIRGCGNPNAVAPEKMKTVLRFQVVRQQAGQKGAAP